MKTIYKNLVGNTESSRTSLVLNRQMVEIFRGGESSADVKITAFSIACTGSTDFEFDLYLRKVVGFEKKDDTSEHYDRTSDRTIVYGTYYIIKGAVVPTGSTIFPLENNLIVFDTSFELLICVKGAEAMTADLILTYE